jgi:hypothetical protein
LDPRSELGNDKLPKYKKLGDCRASEFVARNCALLLLFARLLRRLVALVLLLVLRRGGLAGCLGGVVRVALMVAANLLVCLVCHSNSFKKSLKNLSNASHMCALARSNTIVALGFISKLLYLHLRKAVHFCV